jgi:hypothetical protein
MAKCDEGYLCDVCKKDVETIIESDLYLRYVLGEIPLEQLHLHKERHIRCNPAIAQYITDPSFEIVVCNGPFNKSEMEADYRQQEESRITKAWQRLLAIPKLGISIAEYPLSEA